MFRKSRQVGLVAVIVVLAVAGFIGLQAFGQFDRIEGEALEVCQSFLAAETGERVDPADIQLTRAEVVFPKPLDKRFRTTCTWRDVSVELEAKPFKPWIVKRVTGLD